MTSLEVLIRDAATPIISQANDYDPLMDLIGEARLVLLGEASHGSHEFYRERARITKRLIQDKGFNAIAVEADWPDAHEVDQYVRGHKGEAASIDALAEFKRFPAWMWRNADVLDFIGWLKEHNDQQPLGGAKTGFYGLDLYSLYASMAAVIRYLDKVDPPAAMRARYRYGCFEQYAEDPQAYGYAATFGLRESCEQRVIEQLEEIRQNASAYRQRHQELDPEALFDAEQNAHIVKDAEEYYRAMFHGSVLSWNIRDSHMERTLEHLIHFLNEQAESSKIVLWAHNSHIGDERATEIGQTGQYNIGQLVRQRFPKESVLVGFTTYTGTVTAASGWDAAAERKRVVPALPGSYEALFHEIGIPRFFLNLRHSRELAERLSADRLERAIGVIYHPESERISHYFFARLAEQFDAIIHFDETRAVEPLERSIHWLRGEIPETYPFAV